MRAALAAAAIALASGVARADDLQSRVMVLTTEGAAPATLRGLGADVTSALARGAARTTTSVARGDTSLADTAGAVGCDPSAARCLDEIAAALNIDQLLYARVTATADGATVEVTALTRETEPVRRTFAIHVATRRADLAAIEPAVLDMLEAGEARRASDAPHATAVVALPAPVASSTARPRWPLAIAGGGAVLVVAGAVAWGLASSKQGDIDGAPIATAADLAHLRSLESTAGTDAAVGNLLVIGGAVATAAGLTLWWSRGRHREHAVAVTPTIGPQGGRVTIGGSW